MKSTSDGQRTALVARRIHSVARISGFGKIGNVFKQGLVLILFGL
jgi:hypothetical protein